MSQQDLKVLKSKTNNLAKITALAPANIAFIKYWGKKDEKLRLPLNNSLSINLSAVSTTTTVEFQKRLSQDRIIINHWPAQAKERGRVIKHLDRIRALANIGLFARVESTNNFPQGTGIASSASAFAALTLAASRAAGLNLSEKELSVLARLGSGSACRSIPDGFVQWRAGHSHATSYAHSIYPPDYWDICDLVIVVEEKSKKVSSSEGHALATTSPFFHSRIKSLPPKILETKKALKNKDFTRFGQLIEAEAINMHAVMMTSNPPLYYWLPATLELIHQIIAWRDRGLESYFTLDAGPNLHLICQKKDLPKLKSRLKRFSSIKKIIPNMPSGGARLL